MVNMRYVCVTVHKLNEWLGGQLFSFEAPQPPEWITYYIGQLEKGSDTGRIHAQIYAEANVGYSMRKWKEFFGKSAHIEPRRGTQEQAIAYCRKEDTFLGNFPIDPSSLDDVQSYRWEFGVRHSPSHQGHRHQILQEVFRDALAKPSYSEAMQWLKEQVPRDYVIYNVAISKCLKSEYNPQWTLPQQTN